MLTLNLARRLANGGLVPGATHQWSVFDPATLRNAPVVVQVGRRETAQTGEARVPGNGAAACRAIAEGTVDAAVSAGNTGAMLAAGLLEPCAGVASRRGRAACRSVATSSSTRTRAR